MKRRLSLTQQIFIGLAIGIAVGALISHYDPEHAAIVRPFSQLFLRLIKMIIAPLLFASLVAGIAGAGHFKVVGRMGARAIIYFELAIASISTAPRSISRWPQCSWPRRPMWS